ncbi:MAG: hypothetical protein SVE93_08200 [Candidatus Thermoplasmatota archaeon]|nr:hypothetical protein [Candidatus Thermoplasmatota archaeon]
MKGYGRILAKSILYTPMIRDGLTVKGLTKMDRYITRNCQHGAKGNCLKNCCKKCG